MFSSFGSLRLSSIGLDIIVFPLNHDTIQHHHISIQLAKTSTTLTDEEQLIMREVIHDVISSNGLAAPVSCVDMSTARPRHSFHPQQYATETEDHLEGEEAEEQEEAII